MVRLYACSASARKVSDNSIEVMPCSTRASSKDEANKMVLHFAIDAFPPPMYSGHQSCSQLIFPDLITSVAQEIKVHGEDEYINETEPSVPSVFRDAFEN